MQRSDDRIRKIEEFFSDLTTRQDRELINFQEDNFMALKSGEDGNSNNEGNNRMVKGSEIIGSMSTEILQEVCD